MVVVNGGLGTLVERSLLQVAHHTDDRAIGIGIVHPYGDGLIERLRVRKKFPDESLVDDKAVRRRRPVVSGREIAALEETDSSRVEISGKNRADDSDQVFAGTRCRPAGYADPSAGCHAVKREIADRAG